MNIFYDTSDLNLDDKRNVLNDAFHMDSTKWHVDVREPGEIARKKIDMSFDDILKKLEEEHHFVIIVRMSPLVEGYAQETYLEIGFSTLTSPSYFLWMFLDIEKLGHFIDKYKLKVLR